MSPRMMEGRPSMISEMFMFTSLIYTNQPQQMLIKQTADSDAMFLFFVATYRFFLEKVKCCLNVGPLLENPSAPLSFLWRQITTTLPNTCLLINYRSLGGIWDLFNSLISEAHCSNSP